jgi:hypothetical protein
VYTVERQGAGGEEGGKGGGKRGKGGRSLYLIYNKKKMGLELLVGPGLQLNLAESPPPPSPKYFSVYSKNYRQFVGEKRRGQQSHRI